VLVAVYREDQTAQGKELVREIPGRKTPPSLGERLLEDSALVPNAVVGADVARGGQEKKDRRRLDAVGYLGREIARSTQRFIVDPDARFDAESLLQRRPEPIDKPVDPRAVVAVRLTDEDVVYVPGDVAHGAHESNAISP
jgi:hypothetical protein